MNIFNMGSPQRDLGACTCDFLHGNRPQVKSIYSPGLTAAMQGWNAYCIIPDYDKLAKEEAEQEAQ